MASCSPLGKTQGREWGVSPRRLLSTGQPRTANPAGEHDISAKKASLPRHCPYTSLRGPTQVPTPETLDCSSTVPPEGATPRFREGPSFRQTVDRALYSPPSLYGGCGTPTTPSSNLVRAEPGAEKPPRWYDAPTTPTRAQPACTWGKGRGSIPSFFLADLAALPGGPSVHEVPSDWRRRHVWDDSPPPQYQGRLLSPSLRDLAGPPRWLPPSEGSRQPSCSPRTPLSEPAPSYQKSGNEEPVARVLPHGGDRAYVTA